MLRVPLALPRKRSRGIYLQRWHMRVCLCAFPLRGKSHPCTAYVGNGVASWQQGACMPQAKQWAT
eukprot:10427597-Alexandrium_andersonii.AAC.1